MAAWESMKICFSLRAMKNEFRNSCENQEPSKNCRGAERLELPKSPFPKQLSLSWTGHSLEELHGQHLIFIWSDSENTLCEQPISEAFVKNNQE